MREIVFDTETTGLDHRQGDRVVEIGCVELINRVETGRTYHAYFNPGMAMPSIAEQIHGLSDIFLSDKPEFHETVEDLLDFLDDSPLIAHNAMFDWGFLNHELGECGRMHIPLSRIIDTLAMSKTRHPGAKHSLDALCNRYGVDRSQRVKHGALLDAQLLTQVYVELTGGRQIGLEIGFQEQPRMQTLIQASVPMALNGRRPRFHTVSDDERTRHRLFVTRLIDPLWAQGDSWHEHASQSVDARADTA
ncbi:DNA polymerase III subunit epsilon [Sphingomonas sp.]|uniref:DNA polymerase III subunit epsilon n=1 Tax=Sphingomonas sp. TaxID=28214 RepID=UPI0025F7E546|nr:DNA polymerase III subunit epsilon [Sphingomonas sp.]